MEKICFLFFLFAFSVGCASISEDRLAIDSFQPWASRQLENGRLKVNLTGDMSKPSTKLLEERNKYLSEIQVAHKSIQKEAAALFEEIRSSADNNSETSLTVSGIGIASGIAATALVVASPANAVWVAGLSGVSTGALGYQTRLAQEGFTRDAVYREFERLASEYKTANSEFGEALSILKSNVNTTDFKKWDEGVALAEKSLKEMESTVTLKYLPTGLAEDLEKIKNRDEEILKQIKILQEENKKLKEKVDTIQ